MKKNHISGYSISFLLHSATIAMIFILGSLIPAQPSHLVIDLSIISGGKPAPVAATEAVPEQPRRPERIKPEKPIAKKVVQEIKPITPQPLKEEIVALAKTDTTPDLYVPEEKPVDKPTFIKSQPEEPSDTQDIEPFVNTEVTASVNKQARKNSKEHYLNAHFEYIKNNIQRKTVYPHIARKKGWEGRVTLSFVICEDGSIIDIKIIESSGFSLLDKNAVNTVKAAAPLPLPPVRAEILIPISYTLV